MNIIDQIDAEQMTRELPEFSPGDGTGVERVFQTYSPLIDSVKVKRRGAVRRAKLYYLRDLEGKAARIKEKLG